MSGHTPGYEITPDGRVYSTRYNWRGYGRRELAQELNDHGYPSVRLTIDGKRKRYTVHSLVARHHLPARPSAAHEVRHLDGNKTNPHASNLAWGTRKENADDRERHGRTSRGARHSHSIRLGRSDALTDAERQAILRLRYKGETQRAIADRLGRSLSAVRSAIRIAKATGGTP